MQLHIRYVMIMKNDILKKRDQNMTIYKIISILFAFIANLALAGMIILFSVGNLTDLGNIAIGVCIMVGILAWLLAYIFWKK